MGAPEQEEVLQRRRSKGDPTDEINKRRSKGDPTEVINKRRVLERGRNPTNQIWISEIK